MTTSEPVEQLPAPRLRRPAPRPGQVRFLQSVRSYPCVSVLATTVPADRLDPADANRLRALVDEADRRLRDEGSGPGAADLVARLRGLVHELDARGTDLGVALYVGAGVEEVLTLPVVVEDRVVVDPTFATRDLVRALHRTPRHVVLVLNAREARLFDSVGGELRPVRDGRFPLHSDGGPRERFLRRVDRALGAHRTSHPSPLVVVAPAETAAAFAAVSRHSGRLAGTITVNVVTAPLRELAARTRPVVEAYLRTGEDEALALLDRRLGQQRAATGMPSAWLAARQERPEMLLVDDALSYPARVTADGDWITPATDVEHPDVVDDAVDELIETVLARGGRVTLVADARLARHDGVALTVR